MRSILIRVCITTIALVWHSSLAYSDTCKYGLGYANSTEECSSREAAALARVAEAKTICSSRNSEVRWNKNNKEPSWAWASINAGASAATKGFSVAACERADLVVKYVYDDMSETVTINVTDAEDSSTVFEESRSVSDLRSDAIRMAKHWHDMVLDAQAAQRSAQAAAEKERQEQEHLSKAEEQARLCQSEFESLKQNILADVEVQHTPLPETVQNWIAAHNKRCTNAISPELIAQQEKAEEDAKRAQEEAAKEEALQQKWTALLEQSRANALAAWKHKIASDPFVPPSNGWVHASGLPSSLFYIILPGTGLVSNCHFESDGSRPSLNCLGSAGQHDYFSIESNSRWYLLKSKWSPTGEYAGTVKDGGSTVCLRKAGCYRVLAEVRQDPSELPEKFPVPAPGPLSLTYSNDDFSVAYPQNWHVDERKDKDNALAQVSIAPPDAYLGAWVTHGFFVGHVNKMPAGVPGTLQGAADQFFTAERQRGLTIIGDPKEVQIGDAKGRLAGYTSKSVLSAGENGLLAVVKDKGDGYYWLSMFYPSNDDGGLYLQTFADILKSFKFKSIESRRMASPTQSGSGRSQ